MLYLATHSIHFNLRWTYGKGPFKETRCRHCMDYSFRLSQVRSDCLTCTFRASCCIVLYCIVLCCIVLFISPKPLFIGIHNDFTSETQSFGRKNTPDTKKISSIDGQCYVLLLLNIISSARLSPVPLYGSSTERIEHTTAFITPVVEHWLK